jgi:hypothetical protein
VIHPAARIPLLERGDKFAHLRVGFVFSGQARMSPVGPSRHSADVQQFDRFRIEADIGPGL